MVTKFILAVIIIFAFVVLAMFLFFTSMAIIFLDGFDTWTFIFGWSVFTWVLIITASLAGGLVLRFYVHSVPVFRLRQFSRQAAMDLAQDFTLNTVDDRFGFPSGRFSTSSKKTPNDVYVADEDSTPWATNIISIMTWIYAVPAAFGRFGIVVGIILSVLAAPFALIFYILEIVLRALLRSRVTVRITEAEDNREDVELRFRLRGPSALMIQSNIIGAFSRPELPRRIRTMAGLVPGPERESERTGG